MKLKTLKDLKQCRVCSGEGFEDDGLCCEKEDLRQEAIKWVKEFERRQIFLSDWLNFFNIKEGDLK